MTTDDGAGPVPPGAGEPAALPPLVELPAIRAAAAVLLGVALRTPLVPFGRPERGSGSRPRSLQPIGAFKLRGAYVAAAALSPDERARGLITYSSGNHAQGVARAARLLGVPAVIVMPSDAPAIKRARVEADGAEVVVVGTASDERRRVAEELAATRGLAIIPPFDDPRIVAGQGTVGLEIAEDLPDVAAVLVPVGGGGLASGVAAAITALVPGARLIGVEPELAADARGVARRGPHRPLAGRGREPDDRRRHPDAVDRSPQLRPPVRPARCRSSRCRRRRSPRPCASPRRRHGSSWSRRGRCRSRRCGSTPPRPGWRGCPARSSGVVSGGNVDPDRYLEYLRAPIPPEA